MGRKPAKSGVTVFDIAKAAGVSIATVSRVFNKIDVVDPGVAERILKIAAEKKFSPRQASRSDTLVLVIEEEQGSFFAGYITSLLNELILLAAKRRLRIEIIPISEIDLIRGRYVMGVLSFLWLPASIALFEKIANAPLAAVNAYTDTYAVCSDEAHGMRLALQHFYRRGHREIALLVRSLSSYGDIERRMRFKEIAVEYKNSGLNGTLIDYDCSLNSMLAALAKIYKRPSDGSFPPGAPTALLCTSEEAGIRLMHCFDLLGWRVPQDISVISFEAEYQSEFLSPPHTALKQDYRELVARAVDFFITKNEKITSLSLVPYTLIERESVADLA